MRLFNIDETIEYDKNSRYEGQDIDRVSNKYDLVIRREGKKFLVCEGRTVLTLVGSFEDAQSYIDNYSK